MRRADQEPDEPLLFDLPLDRPQPASPAGDEAAAREPAPAGRRQRSAARERTERLPPPAAAPPALPARPPLAPAAAIAPAPAPKAVSRARRLAGGAADLFIHGTVALIALAGSRAFGVRPTLADWPALALFTLAFSFLYMVVPLAFWGHTVGMAWAGLVSHNAGGEPLTFDQTVRRWCGALLTAATLGLTLLLTGGERSLADRLSGSLTRRGS